MNEGKGLRLQLEREIEDGIVALSDQSRDKGSFTREFRLIGDICSNEYGDSSFAYSLLLFRRYSEIAKDIRDRLHNDRTLHDESAGTNSNNFDYSLSLTSLHTIVSKYYIIFRLGVSLLSLLAVVLMSFVPFVGSVHFEPSNLFSDNCSFTTRSFFRGSFNMQAYQSVISVGVCSCLFGFLIMFFEGLSVVREPLSGPRWLIDKLTWVCSPCNFSFFDRCEIHGPCIAAFLCLALDTTMWLAMLSVAVVASVVLESSTPFIVDMQGTVQFYSLDSFVATYRHTSPRCVSTNPSLLIRLSLFLIFLAVLVQFCILGASLFDYFVAKHNNVSSMPSIYLQNQHLSLMEMQAKSLPSYDLDDNEDKEESEIEVGHQQAYL